MHWIIKRRRQKQMENMSVTIDGTTYYHTPESVTALINSEKDAIASREVWKEKYRDISSAQRIMAGNVHELFSCHYEINDEEVTIPVDEINELLVSIGSYPLRKLWSATVKVEVSLTDIEAETEDDARMEIENYLEITWDREGDSNVENMEVYVFSQE